MMKLETATPDDIPVIAALWHRGWHQGHGAIAPAALVAMRTMPEFTDRTTARLDQTVVARSAGDIAGFYILDGDELYQFYVDAPFQGQGAAVTLMASAEAALAGRLAWLACSVGNDRAAGFYTKAGWQRTGEQAYHAETASGPQTVRIWRFEKDLR